MWLVAIKDKTDRAHAKVNGDPERMMANFPPREGQYTRTEKSVIQKSTFIREKYLSGSASSENMKFQLHFCAMTNIHFPSSLALSLRNSWGYFLVCISLLSVGFLAVAAAAPLNCDKEEED